MGIGLGQVSGAVLILGSVLFIITAFMPISARVFPQADPVKKLAAITAAPRAWAASQVFFGLGSIIMVVGVGLLAAHLGGQPFAWVMWASTAVLALAAVAWVWHLGARATDPRAFTHGALPRWPVMFYFVATEVGLALLGLALLLSPYPPWIGRLVVVGAALLLVLTLAFGDMPPLFFAVLTLVVGIVVVVVHPAALAAS